MFRVMFSFTTICQLITVNNDLGKDWLKTVDSMVCYNRQFVRIHPLGAAALGI